MASAGVQLTAEVMDLQATEATFVVRWGNAPSEGSSRQEAPTPVPSRVEESDVRLLPPTGRMSWNGCYLGMEWM